MKRELLLHTKVQPFASGDIIGRAGFLSGVIGAKIGTAGTLAVTVTHSDDGENFEAVSDKNLFAVKPAKAGEFTMEALEKDCTVNFDLDLAGLKRFMKIEVSGDAATNTTLAIALGDSHVQPV